MNREPSTAARALRGVSLAITLVSIVTFATIAYSAYADVSGVLSSVGRSANPGTGSHYTVAGNTAKLNMSFKVDNSGLLPLAIQLACAKSSNIPITCGAVSVSIKPGDSRTVTLALTITDLARLRNILASNAGLHLNTTATVTLQPFATLAVTFDLGSAISGAAA